MRRTSTFYKNCQKKKQPRLTNQTLAKNKDFSLLNKARDQKWKGKKAEMAKKRKNKMAKSITWSSKNQERDDSEWVLINLH